MSGRLLVKTECPTCGAPLDFTEGANAIRCGHCRAQLLVTGRKQTLSFFIRPKLDVHRAVARALLARKAAGHPARVIQPQLYFLPYYRMTGHEFQWKRVSRSLPSGRPGWNPTLLPNSPTFEPEGGFWNDIEGDQIVFEDRYLEKNFTALEIEETGLYSLGLRPSVLRLELFRTEEMAAHGRIVRVSLDPEDALSRGLTGVDSHRLFYREVVGRVISVVYFPFWVIEMESHGRAFVSILDAVSESLVSPDAPMAIYEKLNRNPAADLPVVGFRPLSCPNCGWDLPFRAEDIIFYCASCRKAWLLRGVRLGEISYRVLEGPRGGRRESDRFLPIWRVEIKEGGKTVRWFIPAFRYRRLKILTDLARSLSRADVRFVEAREAPADLQGCFYDPEDALRLARFLQAGPDGDRHERTPDDPTEWSSAETTLAFIPFNDLPLSWVESSTGFALPKNLLL